MKIMVSLSPVLDVCATSFLEEMIRGLLSELYTRFTFIERYCRQDWFCTQSPSVSVRPSDHKIGSNASLV